jgi:hypothetical protein
VLAAPRGSGRTVVSTAASGNGDNDRAWGVSGVRPSGHVAAAMAQQRVPARSRPDFFLRRQGVATLGEVTRWRPCSADGNGGRFGWRRLDSDGPGLWRRLARTRARRTYEGRGGGPGVGHGTRRRRKRGGGATAGRVSCGAGSRPGSVSSVEQGAGGGGSGWGRSRGVER